MSNNGFWDDMSQVEALNKSPFLPAGESFTCWIDAVQCRQSKDPTKPAGTLWFIAEFTLLASTSVDHPVDAARSWICNATSTMGKPNVKSFVAAALGVDASNIPPALNERFPAVMSQVLGAGNPLSGSIVQVSTIQIMTKKNMPFTRHDWSPAATRNPSSARWEDLIRAPIATPPPGHWSANARHGWASDPSGLYLLNPATNKWEPR